MEVGAVIRAKYSSLTLTDIHNFHGCDFLGEKAMKCQLLCISMYG